MAFGSVPFERRGEPWFDDGNIILVTDNTADAFKVHRGVLARHSEVFQSMFELPQPDSGADMLDGCQIVHMYDLPNELSDLIKALYDGAEFHSDSLEDFFHLAGILRLATKYMIGHLRTQAIRHLTQTWSHTLEGHDAMVSLALTSPLSEGTTYPYVHPLHVLNLAREVNVRLVVPTVLYFLSLYPLDDILRADHPKLSVAHPSCPPSALSPPDLRDYTLMYQFRLDLILTFVSRFCRERACMQASPVPACTRASLKLAGRLARSWMSRTGPLHYMHQAVQEFAEDDGACSACRRKFGEDVALLRKSVWDELPSVAGLPPWSDLIASDLPSPTNGIKS